MQTTFKKIIISRTDNLGDVILTLPLAGFLKNQIKDLEIYFIGKAYTKPLIEACTYVDFFLDRDTIIQNPQLLRNVCSDAILFIFPDKTIAQIAQKANIPIRIGTSHRWFHWLYCNRRIHFSRKKSNLHEAQLNFKLLKPLGFHVLPSFEQISLWYGLNPKANLPEDLETLLLTSKKIIILHPKSKGSAREWDLHKYQALTKILPSSEYHFLITGTAEEGKKIAQELPDLLNVENITDTTGKLSLAQLISLIAKADGLVACSTGPLHIAAALDRLAIGIYPPIRPMHPERWQAIGTNTHTLSLQKNCNACRKQTYCACVNAIEAINIAQILEGK